MLWKINVQRAEKDDNFVTLRSPKCCITKISVSSLSAFLYIFLQNYVIIRLSSLKIYTTGINSKLIRDPATIFRSS